MGAPAPPAQPLSTLIPGLIELSVPDANGVVTVQGERGAAELAKVRITAAGDPVEVESGASGNWRSRSARATAAPRPAGDRRRRIKPRGPQRPGSCAQGDGVA